jgi:hypothetical protein
MNPVWCANAPIFFGWHVMPHLMGHPVSVFLDSCFRRNDKHTKETFDVNNRVLISETLLAIGHLNLFGPWDLVIEISLALSQEILFFHRGKSSKWHAYKSIDPPLPGR